MHYIEAFFRFWYDFLVGDDWRIAVAVVVTLLVTAAVAHWLSHTAAGAVLVIGVVLTSASALRRSVREGA
ncbi:MAG: hypothetical protein ACR2PL_08290 [Dehalococcoidia bacterium]